MNFKDVKSKAERGHLGRVDDDDLMEFLGWLEDAAWAPDDEDHRKRLERNVRKELRKRGFKASDRRAAMNRKDREALAERCIRMAEMLVGSRSTAAAWPGKVEKGGLRKKMGLKTDKSLEEQSSPSDVVKFFNGTDAEGRGMVMFAVNSNKGSAFWKKVGAALGKQSKEGSRRTAAYSRDWARRSSYRGIDMELVGTWQDLAAYYRGSDGNYWKYQSRWVNMGPRIRNTRGETLDGKDIETLPDLSREASARMAADDTTAFRMFTGKQGQMVMDMMTGAAETIGNHFQEYRNDVLELERIAQGRGMAEAPGLMKQLLKRVSHLKTHVDKMEKAMSKAAR